MYRLKIVTHIYLNLWVPDNLVLSLYYSGIYHSDKGNNQNEMWHWTNDEIGVAVQSWLSGSWTHGLIAQSAKVYEQNSVIVDSNPTQADFL